MTRPSAENKKKNYMSYGKIKVIKTGENATFTQGAFCSVAENVRAYLGGHHRMDYVTTYPFGTLMPNVWGKERYGHPPFKGDIVIGSDVWIGDNVSIMPNVVIGHGACIGCGSIVTKDVEPYSVVAGNPAKLIRYRFEREIIEELLDIAWWDLDQAVIKELVPFLMNEDVKYNLPRIRQIISEHESKKS